jgi:hypothetical protein
MLLILSKTAEDFFFFENRLKFDQKNGIFGENFFFKFSSTLRKSKLGCFVFGMFFRIVNG